MSFLKYTYESMYPISFGNSRWNQKSAIGRSNSRLVKPFHTSPGVLFL